MHMRAIVDGMVRKSPSDKVTFELGIKGSDEVSQEDRGRMVQAKNIYIYKIYILCINI